MKSLKSHLQMILVLVICVFAAILYYATGDMGTLFALPLMGMALTQGNMLKDILKWEEDNFFSREAVTIASGQDLDLGAVVGKITLGTCPTTGTAGSNTGAGTCTGVTAGLKAKLGIYVLKCIIAQTGAGVFSVKDPDGYGLPNAVVAHAYTDDQINFTLNDGSPDFVIGDTFTITIAAGSGYVTELDPDGVNGSQDAYGFVIAAYDATDGAIAGVVICRNAIIADANLAWPAGASAGEKATALAQLAAKGIVTTDEV
jgi:hypothetical protein